MKKKKKNTQEDKSSPRENSVGKILNLYGLAPFVLVLVARIRLNAIRRFSHASLELAIKSIERAPDSPPSAVIVVCN